MDRIRVLAADDNPLVRKQLEAFLNGKDDLELVGVAEDGTGALEIMREKPVDVLLLDMVMPKMDGFSVLKEMNTLDLVHKPHVIVITAPRLAFAETAQVSAALIQKPAALRHSAVELLIFSYGVFAGMKPITPFHALSPNSFPSRTICVSLLNSASSASLPASVMA